MNQSTQAGSDSSRLTKRSSDQRPATGRTAVSYHTPRPAFQRIPGYCPHPRQLPDRQVADSLSPRSGGHDTRHSRHNLQLRSGWCQYFLRLSPICHRIFRTKRTVELVRQRYYPQQTRQKSAMTKERLQRGGGGGTCGYLLKASLSVRSGASMAIAKKV